MTSPKKVAAMTRPPDSPPDPVSQTVEAIARIHAQAEQQMDPHQRAVEMATSLLARPIFLRLVLLLVALWVLFNTFARRLGWVQFDPPPFYWLQGVVGLGALLMTIVVVTKQNRQGQLAERRAQLDLQINLLTEQKVAKLIDLVEELRRDLPSVRNRQDAQAEAMIAAADPHAVMMALEVSLDHSNVIEELAQAVSPP